MEKEFILKGEKLPIYTYPSKVLVTVASPVLPHEFTDELKTLAHNMLFTMYKAPGIGLAAPQIGLSKRLFVVDVDFEREKVTRADGSEDYNLWDFNPLIMVNPKIVEKDGEIVYEEGCLSVPGIYEDVKRFERIKVEYQDLDGQSQTLEATELLAICIQHENDHLDGIVFLDRLSLIKKNLYKKRLQKEKERRGK